MQKKAQPSKNQPNKNKTVIIDQQNEPFLKTISKRVRNINKKIAQIADLKKRDDLKPQQIQKINRKAEYELERTRLEQKADFFRQVYAQNAEYYKNNQLQQLDTLALAIAALRTKTQFKESEKLAEVNKVITEASTLSYAESAKNISETLRRFASDYKLKKALSALIQESSVQNTDQVKQPEQVVVQTPQVPSKVEPVKQQKPVIQEQPKVQAPKQTVPEVQKVEQPVQQTEAPVENKPVIEGQQSQAPTEEKKRYRNDRPKGEYRPRTDNRNRKYNQDGQTQGQEGGQRRRQNNNGKNGQRKPRPNYRPKQENRNPDAQQSDYDSSLEKEQEARNFRRDQIRKLEDDGFTVVGKPKPKAHDQKQWHEHTHGRKNHYHNKKQTN